MSLCVEFISDIILLAIAIIFGYTLAASVSKSRILTAILLIIIGIPVICLFANWYLNFSDVLINHFR